MKSSARNIFLSKRGLIPFALSFLISCSPLLKERTASHTSSTPRDKSENLPSECDIFYSSLNLCATLTVDNPPLRYSKVNTLTLNFWDIDHGRSIGPFIDLSNYFEKPITPTVWLWMKMKNGSHPSLGTETLIQKRDSSGAFTPGVYEVNNVQFTMKGPWEIHIDLEDADGNKVNDPESFKSEIVQ